MHPHIPRPRRKATRTCTDTASVVRTVHGEFMWPFTARVSKNRTDRTDRCRCNLPPPKGRPQADLCSTVKRPTPGLRALPPMTAQIATVLGPALDEPGALQQPSTVHVSEGSWSCQNAPQEVGRDSQSGGVSGGDRGDQWLDANNVHDPCQIVGQDGKCHLCGHFW